MFGQFNGQIANLLAAPGLLIGAIVQNVVQIGINIAINIGPIS